MAEAENVDDIMERGQVGGMDEVAHDLAAGLQELHDLDTSCGDKNITLNLHWKKNLVIYPVKYLMYLALIPKILVVPKASFPRSYVQTFLHPILRLRHARTPHLLNPGNQSYEPVLASTPHSHLSINNHSTPTNNHTSLPKVSPATPDSHPSSPATQMSCSTGASPSSTPACS